MEREKKKYYLGLDIGTDSVGYAASDKEYNLLKFRGEPVWGTTTFEAASLADERRSFRASRRRLDRKKQRVQLLSEIFANDICAIDKNFFIRRKESALFSEDTEHGVNIFDGGITDKEYHSLYPTIHHLINHLMETDEKQDVRLVFLACAWLVANRGHFLFDVDSDRIGDFSDPYADFISYFTEEAECSLPWSESITPDIINDIMQADAGVTKKKELFKNVVYSGNKVPNKPDEEFPFRRDCIVTLLSGGKVAPKDLFVNDDYAEIDSVSLGMDSDNFDRIISDLGDDSALLRTMRAMYDCALLNITRNGRSSISEAKIDVYNRHAEDLKWLKYFIRKYKPSQYYKVFRSTEKGGYTTYSQNYKSVKNVKDIKNANAEDFSDFITKIVKDTKVKKEDAAKYDDMMNRLSQRTFMPKQKTTDNRVIPQQIYRNELCRILDKAQNYLPMLNESDTDGTTNKEKIISIFDFKIPYYVGPLNRQSSHAWIERKAEKIFPWNFEKIVDLDKSEQNFIARMTNVCSYLPGESVLPSSSLLYSRFAVLNEINNIKINGNPISVETKKDIYTNLIAKSNKKVTKAEIAKYLKSNGCMNPDDEISGIDISMTSALKSQRAFSRMLKNGTLTEEEAEEIINRAAYSEDKGRMLRWLEAKYKKLSDADRKYIIRLNLKGFGRLSEMFLDGIVGCKKDGTGEAMTIIEALWETNENLMQLLSDSYTYGEAVETFIKEYYSDNDNVLNLSDRLTDMYISNAVKRPIIRTLDIVSEVVKAAGGAPEKIFVEMARGGTAEQKGKRTLSRKQQILTLYKNIASEDAKRLKEEIEAMGGAADNRLQSDRLYLYYMQLGKCMYSGESIDLSSLSSKIYDIDHIYPQSKVTDDSILNNKVLVLSTENGEKGDDYPVKANVREKMTGFWTMLKNNGLITDEKYRRLTRKTGFTEDELHQFINRQLVETRQSTKAVATLLRERYPDTEIVYVKAGLVSDFRHDFDMLKCRSVNDLHHAKDAYLNVVVGNVYHEKFTKRFFDVSQKYNVSVKKIFDREQSPYGNTVWNGSSDIEKVRKTVNKNAVHLTRYAFCRKGGLFDQNPVRADAGLVSLKKGLDTEKYGGYKRTTASFYLLASYITKGKKDVMFVPVELLYADKVEKDRNFAEEYVAKIIADINGKTAENVSILLGGRPIKINTVLSLDGMKVVIRGKDSGGKYIITSPVTPLILGADYEKYVKKLEKYSEKKKSNQSLILDEDYSGINADENIKLYDTLTYKLSDTAFKNCPGNFAESLIELKNNFISLPTEEQVPCLLSIVNWFGFNQTCDLKAIGGSSMTGSKRISSKLSSLLGKYDEIKIVDSSASGLFTTSENLLDLL